MNKFHSWFMNRSILCMWTHFPSCSPLHIANLLPDLVHLLYAFLDGGLLMSHLCQEDLHPLQVVERVFHGGFRLAQLLGCAVQHLRRSGAPLRLPGNRTQVVDVDL